MTITASNIKLKKKSRVLAITFNDGNEYEFSFEYLRVLSPSAEVRGHGKSQEVLQWGKKNVDVEAINPVGHYAIQIVYDDGHNSGLYSWDYLYELGANQTANWEQYLQKLNDENKPRDPDLQIITL